MGALDVVAACGYRTAEHGPSVALNVQLADRSGDSSIRTRRYAAIGRPEPRLSKTSDAAAWTSARSSTRRSCVTVSAVLLRSR